MGELYVCLVYRMVCDSGNTQYMRKGASSDRTHTRTYFVAGNVLVRVLCATTERAKGAIKHIKVDGE